MMPSITEIPNNAIKPIAADTLNGVPVRISAKIPPTIAIGMTVSPSNVSASDEKLK